MPEYDEEEEAMETKYVYFVSYVFGEPGVISFGVAEAVLSKPVSEFDDVIGIGKAIAATIVGTEAVSVLNWRLLREEVNQDENL